MALLRLCGLWPTKDAKSGKVVMSGKILGVSVMIMRADTSKARNPSKAPKYDLVLASDEEEKSGRKQGGEPSEGW